MAHMNQEKKARIATELKKAMPKDWKYSLSVRNHSTIVLTIQSAPIDLLAHVRETLQSSIEPRHREVQHITTYYDVNQFYLENQFRGNVLKTFEQIKAALNTNNHDNSDIMSDYFDVGHYVDICIGKWDKPFICK